MVALSKNRVPLWRTGLEALLCVVVIEGALVGVMYLAGGTSTLSTFLSWPTGSIWSNELATASLLFGGAFGILRKMEQHHQAVHDRIDGLHDRLDVHHDALKSHVAEELGKVHAKLSEHHEILKGLRDVGS